MKPTEFCYWLQGYFEIAEASANRSPEGLTSGQIDTIRRHLAMVFKLEGSSSAVKTTPANPDVLMRC